MTANHGLSWPICEATRANDADHVGSTALLKCHCILLRCPYLVNSFPPRARIVGTCPCRGSAAQASWTSRASQAVRPAVYDKQDSARSFKAIETVSCRSGKPGSGMPWLAARNEVRIADRFVSLPAPRPKWAWLPASRPGARPDR